MAVILPVVINVNACKQYYYSITSKFNTLAYAWNHSENSEAKNLTDMMYPANGDDVCASEMYVSTRQRDNN